MNVVHDTAKKLVSQGICVVPCMPKSKIPACSWRKYQTKLPDKYELHDLFYMYPRNNIAVVTGAISQNLCVLDLDCGIPNALKWVNKNKITQETRKVVTADGMHVWLHVKNPPKYDLSSDGVEVKFGSLCMIPPSIHPSGKPYKWMGEHPIIDIDDLGELGMRAAAPPVTRMEGKNFWHFFDPLGFNPFDEGCAEVFTFHTGLAAAQAAEIPEPIRNLETRREIIHQIKKKILIPQIFGVSNELAYRYQQFHCPHPNHDDDRASFIFDTKTNRYRCLAPTCELHNNNQWFDVIDFYRIMARCDLWRALTDLGRLAGVV